MKAGRIRVLKLFSDLEHSKTFELTARHLDRDRFDVRALFLNPPRAAAVPLERAFAALGIPTQSWKFEGRRDYLSTLLRLTRHLRDEQYHAVHAELMWADYVGMPAAWLARVPVRLMTRWHATVHHREHPSGLKYDRVANRLATRIIAPSRVAYRIVTEWEHVPASKVTLLSPPLDFDRFSAPPPADVAAVRARYNPDRRYPVIGVVARWVDWKGIQFVIPAVERLLERYPDLLLLLFNTVGEFGDTLRPLLARLPERNYRVVPFEPMSEALYQIFDLFVHVPVDGFVENFGYVYAEALAAGVPSIFTLSGVATGLVEHMTHCYVVPYQSADAVHDGLRALADNPELARRLGAAGQAITPPEFRPDVHCRALERLYAEGIEHVARDFAA